MAGEAFEQEVPHMHKLILGKRNAIAQTRILNTADRLAKYFEIDPAKVLVLQVQEKDPEVRAMKQREGVADLLDAIALELDLLTPVSLEEDAQTVAFPLKDLAPVSTPDDGAPVQTEEESEDLAPSVTGETGEGLPSPVVEIDHEPKAAAVSKKKK